MKNTAVISSKCQIVIPSALRKRYRLNEGTTVVFQKDSGRLVLEPRNHEALYALRGTLSHLPLEEELQAMRAEERREKIIVKEYVFDANAILRYFRVR